MVALLSLLILAGCDSDGLKPSGELDNQWLLPSYLNEASGLAFSNNQLLVHDDESAVIYSIDQQFKQINKVLQFGDPMMIEDLEGIAVNGKRVFLMNSEGLIFSVDKNAAVNGIAKDITTWDTELKDFCELEGLEYYDDLLLIPCKVPRHEYFESQLTVFSFDPETGETEEFFKLLMDQSSDGFALTGVTYLGDDFYILAARYLIIVNPVTSISRIIPLSRNVHQQPEGIAVTPEGRIFIVDDYRKGIGRITRYENLDHLVSLNAPE